MRAIVLLFIVLLLVSSFLRAFFWLFPYLLLVGGVYMLLNLITGGRSRRNSTHFNRSDFNEESSNRSSSQSSNPNVIDVEFEEREVEDDL